MMNHIDRLNFVHNIAPGIYLIHGPGKAQFPNCHGFLLQGEQTILIDAGVGEARIRDIDRQVRIDTLIISHSHPDHILAWHTLADRQLFLPAQTPDSVGDLRLLGQRFVDGSEGARYWTDVAERRLSIRPLRPPDHRFKNGEVLDFGSLQLQAIHAPGHLDDHYCFLEHSSRTLFSIDIDFTGFGPWYGNPEGDINRFRESVHRLQSFHFNQICASHKLPIPKSESRDAFDRYLNAFDRQKAAVYDLCVKGMNIEEMIRVSPFYRNRMPDQILQRIFETQMIRKNLALLKAANQIYEKNRRYEAA